MPNADLDRTDAAIVAALQNNARLTNKELAAQVGLAPSTCLERVRRLTASGVLRGFHARVDPAALGIGLQALVSVQLARHQKNELAQFVAAMSTLREVVATHHLAGANDFILHVAVRDAAHLRTVTVDAIGTRPEVGHVETALIFDYERAAVLPDYTQDEPEAPPAGRATRGTQGRRGR